jgi:hypothetical protein
MTAQELKQLQQRIKFDAPSMAICFGIPYHTYRNYLYGENAIPANIERAALELESINKNFIAEAPGRIDERINREFPYGVPSEL